MTPFKSASRLGLAFALLLCVIPAFAKDPPLQVIDWPSTGTPLVRFSFGRFKETSDMNGQRNYVVDTMAKNLSTKPISAAQFSLYLFDKNKVRIGEDTLSLNNLAPGETVKFQSNILASGVPVTIAIQDQTAQAKSVSMTINSTPQGAILKVDGAETGTTPRVINVGIGKHTLVFTKEGFTNGTFPLEISPNDVSGGSVSFELGSPSFDSIELRDGSVINGNLVSIAGMDVEIRVGGNIQHIDRNKIKRVIFVQRDAPSPDPIASSPPTR